MYRHSTTHVQGFRSGFSVFQIQNCLAAHDLSWKGYSIQSGLSAVMGHWVQRLTAAGQQSNQKETLGQKGPIIKNIQYVFDKLIWPQHSFFCSSLLWLSFPSQPHSLLEIIASHVLSINICCIDCIDKLHRQVLNIQISKEQFPIQPSWNAGRFRNKQRESSLSRHSPAATHTRRTHCASSFVLTVSDYCFKYKYI